MTVEHLRGESHRRSFLVAGDVEIGGPGRVNRNEYIRNDSSAAIDCPSSDGLEDCAGVHLYAVCIVHLPAGVTLVDVVAVVVGIWLLDAPSGRSVEPGHSQPDS